MFLGPCAPQMLSKSLNVLGEKAPSDMVQPQTQPPRREIDRVLFTV